MYTEEVDLCYRLTQAGWGLWYVPEAVVTHFGEASSKQVREAMYLQLYRSKLQFYRKFGGAARARQAKALLALAYAPRWAAASLAAPAAGLAQPRARPSAWLRACPHGDGGQAYGRLLAELVLMKMGAGGDGTRFVKSPVRQYNGLVCR